MQTHAPECTTAVSSSRKHAKWQFFKIIIESNSKLGGDTILNFMPNASGLLLFASSLACAHALNQMLFRARVGDRALIRDRAHAHHLIVLHNRIKPLHYNSSATKCTHARYWLSTYRYSTSAIVSYGECVDSCHQDSGNRWTRHFISVATLSRPTVSGLYQDQALAPDEENAQHVQV